VSVPLLIVAGTRPEVLKLAPVVDELRRHRTRFDVRVCLSGQHGEMAREIAREVGMAVDFEPTLSERPPGLSESFAELLVRLGAVVAQVRPRGVVVQGDTNTALAAGLAAFHAGVPVFHVEAGLRTSAPSRPFPEEMNRRLLARLAVLHFAPTEGARMNLLAEGVAGDAIVVTGNTVIDALSLFGAGPDSDAPLDAAPRKLVLVTLHRRESEGSAKGVVDAARTLADRADTEIVWVRHPNATGRAASEGLSHAPHVRVIEPQPYRAFVTLLRRARVVLTDSGGVQEEACALGVPVVVLRAETDRPEAVRAGNAVVVGTEAAAVAAAATAVLEAEPQGGRDVENPFGDGRAAARIAGGIERFFDAERT
jgi:UDP-N-acetylglucosamine 2-epimerase (non-hydrolysing)